MQDTPPKGPNPRLAAHTSPAAPVNPHQSPIRLAILFSLKAASLRLPGSKYSRKLSPLAIRDCPASPPRTLPEILTIRNGAEKKPMDSGTYPHPSQAGKRTSRSRITSPQTATAQFDKPAIVAKMLPNILTEAESRFDNPPPPPAQSRPLQRSEHQLSPVFAHLGHQIGQKRHPKSLTLCTRVAASASGFAALRQSPEKPHL